MRKFATALASVLLIVGLSACDSGEVNSSGPTASTVAPSATPSPTFSEEPTEAPTLSDETVEQIFLDSLHEEIPETAVVDDEISLTLAENICLSFDTGASFEDVALTIMDSSDFWTPDNTGMFMGLSVGAFCPEHSDVVSGGSGI